jgi:hypothetical protein
MNWLTTSFIRSRFPRSEIFGYLREKFPEYFYKEALAGPKLNVKILPVSEPA